MFFSDLTILCSDGHAEGVRAVPPTSRRIRYTATYIAALLLLVVTGLPVESMAQGRVDYFTDPLAFQPFPSSPFYAILLRAWPDDRIQATELDAVRVIEGKLAVAAAMRSAAMRAADERMEYGKPGADGRYRFANTPREVANALRQSLGPSSLVARSADALALVTDALEYTAQIPLDRVNDLTDVLVEQARRAGLRNFPVFRLRSRIENDRAGVTLSARW